MFLPQASDTCSAQFPAIHTLKYLIAWLKSQSKFFNSIFTSFFIYLRWHHRWSFWNEGRENRDIWSAKIRLRDSQTKQSIPWCGWKYSFQYCRCLLSLRLFFSDDKWQVNRSWLISINQCQVHWRGILFYRETKDFKRGDKNDDDESDTR